MHWRVTTSVTPACLFMITISHPCTKPRIHVVTTTNIITGTLFIHPP